jgi:hypothetical protein
MNIEPSAQVTMDNVKTFHSKYIAAVRTGKKTFMFEGQEVAVEYAKYVVEYFFGKKL